MRGGAAVPDLGRSVGVGAEIAMMTDTGEGGKEREREREREREKMFSN